MEIYFDNFFKSVLFFSNCHQTCKFIKPLSLKYYKEFNIHGQYKQIHTQTKNTKNSNIVHVQWGILMQALM